MTQAPEEHTEVPSGARPIDELRLRPSRPPVTRLSRTVLISVGLVAAASIGAALVLALRPQQRPAAPELVSTTNRTTPEGLSGLPKDYVGLPKDVPKLGPPLPGDLGRPIVDAGAPAPAMGEAAPASDPVKQQAAQDLEAARSSHLFSDTGAVKASGGAEDVAASANPAAAATSPAAVADGASQDNKLAFLNGQVDRRTVSASEIEAPASPYVLQAGAVIAAALITGLRSDLPGQVTAQVSEDVYDSPTGTNLLIPEGARLIGQYDAQVSFGQSRALLVWTRLILPNGRSIVLERQPAADAQGYAGLQDRVDNHWGAFFKAAVLSTTLSVGAEAGTGTGSNENSLVQAIRQGASQGVNQIGEQVVGRSLNVQPTLTIRPGYPVRVMVTRDLVLEPYRG